MNLQNKGRHFSPQEVKTLEALEELEGESGVGEIVEFKEMSQSAVMRAALSLKEKGLVSISEIDNEEVSLTEEGREYTGKPLPERKVLEFINEEGPVSIDDLSRGMDLPKNKIGISVGWVKRKNWADIVKEDDEKILRISDEGVEALGEEGRDEVLLREFEDEEKIFSDRIAPDLRDQIPILRSRGLLEVRKRRNHSLTLTEKGERLLKDGIDLKRKVSELTSDLLKDGKWRETEFREYNVTAPCSPVYPGKEHPQRRMIEKLRSILLRMGFKEIRGPIVESEFWNFDALFQAQNHPAREIHDTLSLSKPKRAKISGGGFEGEVDEEEGKKILERVKGAHEGNINGSKGWDYDFDEEISHRTILRSQTTADSIRYLAGRPDPPVKIYCIGKVFRRERIDYQHLAEFPQAEGIVMAPDLDFRNMLGYLKQILLQMGLDKIRFRPGYFPYTEPSAEADGYFSELGEWIELLGAGMFRPEVLEPLGIDYPVLAWGIGFSRLAMIRMRIEDMRDLHNNDIEWLKNRSLR